MIPGWAAALAVLAYVCALFAVAHFGDQSHVVRDQQNRHVALFAQLFHQIEYSRLHRNV